MNKQILCATGLLCTAACLLNTPRPPRAEVRAVAQTGATSHLKDAALEQRVRAAIGSMPLRFEENLGQADRRTTFLARGGGFLLALAPREADFLLHTPRVREKKPPQLQAQGTGWAESLAAASVVQVQFAGASADAQLTGLEPQAGHVRYLYGNDASRWQREVPHYSRVRDEGIYPGIDAVFYGDRRQLEYDFVVAPGADPSAIRMHVEGAASVELTKEGGVLARTPAGVLTLLPPKLYQQAPGQVRGSEVSGRYVWRAPGEIGFEVASYDHQHTLVIDPPVNVQRGTRPRKRHPQGSPPDSPPPTGDSVALSTLLGGSYDDSIQAIAVGATSGHVYVAGFTDSYDFPIISDGFYQGEFGGSLFNASCSPVPYSYPYTISTFPCGDAFVAEFDVSTLTAPQLVNTTYLGGSGDDAAWGMALDANDNVYLVGATNSADFPMASQNPGYLQSAPPAACSSDGTLRPCHHVFFSVLGPGLDRLIYSTYLAGSDDDEGYAVAVNATGQAFLTGVAGPNFPTTACQGDCDPYNDLYSGAGDVFVAEIDPTGTLGTGGGSLIYSTYIGGDGTDEGLAITVDDNNQAYVGGVTYSTLSNAPFPINSNFGGPLQSSTSDNNNCGPGFSYTCGDGFAAVFSSDGTGLIYSTFIGGSGTDQVNGIAQDGFGDIYLTGQTNSDDLVPVADCNEFCEGQPYQPNYISGYDAFITGFFYQCTCSGPSQLFLASYLGGIGDDIGLGIALDTSGDIFVSGSTNSPPNSDPGFPLQIPLQANSNVQYYTTTSFLTVFTPDGSSLIFSTYFGGLYDYYGNSPTDVGTSIALDATGRIYLAGRTTSFTTPDNSAGLCLINQVPGASNDSFPYPDYNGFVAIINPTNTPAACFSPSLPQTIDFGGVLQGMPSPPTSTNPALTIFDQSSADLMTTASFTGANPGDFAINNNVCSAQSFPAITQFDVPAGGGACQLFLTFTPSTTGPESATLMLTNGSPGSPFMIALSGTGLPPATATLTPNPLAFNSVTVNTPSTLSATLTNTSGSSPLDVTGSVVTGSGDFVITNDTCSGTTVAPAGFCSIFITYTPSVGGPAPATTLKVTDDGVGGSQTIALTGTGAAPPPTIMLPPIGLNFAPQGQGTTSLGQGVTITNTAAAGASNLVITQPLTFTGTNPGDYAASGCTTPVAPAGGICTVTVTFTPGGVGPRSATLQIASNASNGTQTINVTGTGLAAPTATPLPSPLNFATPQVVNTTSAPMNVTLSNTGGSSLSITSILLTGGNMGDFAISSNGCGTSLGAGGNCVVAITFTPTATGPRSTTLQFTDALGTQNVTVNGTGATGPTAALTPPTLTFVTPQQVNTSSGTLPATLTNGGGAALSITNITTTGDFSPVSNTCGGSLAANSACTINVAFTPTAAGTRNGTLVVTDAVGVQMINLTGSGVTPPAVMLSTSSLTFGTQAVGVTSTAMPVMLTNTGGSQLNISSISPSGDFAEMDNCVPSVASLGSCMIMVTFTPTGAGTRNGAILITDNAAGSPQTVMLTGTGSTNVPGFNLSAPLFFGAVIVGTTSSAQVVTITNSGGAPLSIMSATTSAQFGAVNGCTVALTTGQNCMISVTFSPTAMGQQNGTLTIMDNAPGSPHVVQLSGLGATFTLAPPSGSPSSLTINPGDTANFSVGLTSTPGLVLSLSLGCTSTAPYTICSVSPSTVTLGGPTTPVVTVTLQTNCIGNVVGPRTPQNGPISGIPAPIGALWAAILLLFGLARRSHAAGTPGRWAARAVPICAALVLVLLVVGFAACVSNNPPAIPGSPTTPAGTYNVIVTANGQNITKQLNLIVRVI